MKNVNVIVVKMDAVLVVKKKAIFVVQNVPVESVAIVKTVHVVNKK